MPRKKGLKAEVRQMAATGQIRGRPAKSLARHLTNCDLYQQLRSVTEVLYEVKTQCLACPPDPDAAETVIAGPCGPPGFAETVASDTEPVRVLSWPNSPERYAQSCLNAARQNITNVNLRQNTIRTGAEPAQSYAPDDRNLYQWGLCTECRRTLADNYASADRDQSHAALLRWGLAIYLGRNIAGSRFQDYRSAMSATAGPDSGNADAGLSLLNVSQTTQINRLNRELQQVVNSAAAWRQSGLTQEGLLLRETALELPIRMAGYVPTWISLPRPPERIAVVAIYPQLNDIPTTATAPYPHRCVIGMVDEPGAATACEGFLDHGRRDLSRSIQKWLPEMGDRWEHLYLSAVDYANRKRVPPKARQLMSAACGRRMAAA